MAEMIYNELDDVQRIGGRSVITFPCASCGGCGYVDTGFQFGSNVSNTRRCLSCNGSGQVWREAAPKLTA